MEFQKGILLLLILGLTLIKVEGTICPPIADTNPCYCFDGLQPGDPRQELRCTEGATQETLNNLLQILGTLNNVTSTNPLVIRSLSLMYTSITTLDLSGLAHLEFDTVDIQYNHQIKEILPYESGTGKFKVGLLLLQQSGITDTTVANLLQFVDPESLKRVVILGSEVHGGANEFLAGLSNFKNLQEFRIEQSGTVNLAGGQFRSHKRLSSLTFQVVGMTEVGPDAFLLDGPPDEDLEESQFHINLGFNNISHATFSQDHGLLSIGRPLYVYLEGNQFEFVPRETFESLLLADERNFLDFEWNQMICDQRMQYLRDGKARYQAQVKGVVCKNDPNGKDIFETDLLP